VLLTSGVVAGASTYDFRLDLRVVYQHLCKNHPRADEPAYPLNTGLPKNSTLTRAELERRVEACLGARLPAAQRTPEQARALQTITSVIRIPASSIQGHMSWATWSLQDVIDKVGGGNALASPLGNQSVRYAGSADDAALNQAVLRYTPDAGAKARFEADINHGGRFRMPVLTAHGINDSTVFVESHEHLNQRMAAAGAGARLVQTFVDSGEHSYWGDEMYPPLFDALLAWVEKGNKPTPQSIAARCKEMAANGAGTSADRCRFLPDYSPKPLATRVVPR
jgi:hypothetical protein